MRQLHGYVTALTYNFHSLFQTNKNFAQMIYFHHHFSALFINAHHGQLVYDNKKSKYLHKIIYFLNIYERVEIRTITAQKNKNIFIV